MLNELNSTVLTPGSLSQSPLEGVQARRPSAPGGAFPVTGKDQQRDPLRAPPAAAAGACWFFQHQRHFDLLFWPATRLAEGSEAGQGQPGGVNPSTFKGVGSTSTFTWKSRLHASTGQGETIPHGLQYPGWGTGGGTGPQGKEGYLLRADTRVSGRAGSKATQGGTPAEDAPAVATGAGPGGCPQHRRLKGHRSDGSKKNWHPGRD
jgi:hypothetical protein